MQVIRYQEHLTIDHQNQYGYAVADPDPQGGSDTFILSLPT